MLPANERSTPAALRAAALAAAILWLGGFTFYALFVIPSGVAVLGDHRQFGFVTERVTRWLNGLAALALLLDLPALRRPRWQRCSWVVAAGCTAALVGLHAYARSFLDFAHRDVHDPETFYQVHRAYLLTAAVQWLAFVSLLADRLRSTRPTPAP
ncbi:MAG: hypothetical protein R3F56_13480 [Planctomycetota bacterium]